MAQTLEFLPDTRSADRLLELAAERPELARAAVETLIGIALPSSDSDMVAALTWVVAELSREDVVQLVEKLGG